jgi:hypothetical protein
MLTLQASILAHIDVFAVTAAAAFLMVPVAFLFRPTKARQQPGAGHLAPAHASVEFFRRGCDLIFTRYAYNLA